MLAPDPAKPSAVKEAVGGIVKLLTGLIAAKRASPGGDLLSAMISAPIAVKPGELRWRPSFRSRGLLELPVTWPTPDRTG